jgi:hypothetical protein
MTSRRMTAASMVASVVAGMILGVCIIFAMVRSVQRNGALGTCIIVAGFVAMIGLVCWLGTFHDREEGTR